MGQHRFLFIGGCRDGEWVNLNRSDMHTVVMPVPRPLVFVEVSTFDGFPDLRTEMYYRHWVKCSGWRVFFPAYLLAGLHPRHIAGGTVLPGGIVGREPDAWSMEMGHWMSRWVETGEE